MKKPFQLFSIIWPIWSATPLALTLALALISTVTAQAQQTATEQEAQAIGVDAYLYFYSLVTMDITRTTNQQYRARERIWWANELVRKHS